MKLRDHLDATWPMPAGEGPCRTWPFSPGCGCLELPDPAPGGIDPETLTPDERFAVEAATWQLWSLTAGRYGLCEQTVRPCRTPAGPRTRADAWPVPVLAGQWFNVTCGCQPADDGCGCPGGGRLLLPGTVQWEYERPLPPPQPALAPLMVVWMDGKPLPPTAWRFAPPNRLYRVDGGTWPATQDMSLPLTEPGTFGVTHWTGEPVPPLGRRAAAVLACELLKACEGDTSCALPTHWVERIDREGIEYTMFDPLELIVKGRTGLPEVDQFIAVANPGRHRGPSLVLSPDLPTWVEDFAPPLPVPDDLSGLANSGYAYEQTTAADMWLIPHPLESAPAEVRVVDADGREHHGRVRYPAAKVVQLHFDAPVAGTAYLSGAP